MWTGLLRSGSPPAWRSPVALNSGKRRLRAVSLRLASLQPRLLPSLVGRHLPSVSVSPFIRMGVMAPPLQADMRIKGNTVLCPPGAQPSGSIP